MRELGCGTPAALREAGAKHVWLALKQIDPGVCLMCLYGLEGAIRNVAIRALPTDVKEDLKQFVKESRGGKEN